MSDSPVGNPPPPGHTGGITSTIPATRAEDRTHTQPDDASYQLAEYRDSVWDWLRVRAACAGEKEVKQIPGVLPRLNPTDQSPENNERNLHYLQRAVYFNATGRTMEGLVGLAFAKNPEINVGPFQYMLDNVDGKGASIYASAQISLSDVLQTGRGGLLSDMVNGKPSIVRYPAEAIINWRYIEENGKKTLVLLVLYEIVQEQHLKYGSLTYEQFREYRLEDGVVSLQIWRRQYGNQVPEKFVTPSLARPDAKNPNFTEIPFTFCGAVSNTPDIQPAPLRGLADMNLAHFRNSADFEDSVWFCGQPQSFITNLDELWRDWLNEQKIYIGSRKILLLPKAATFGIVQALPNTLAREAMEQKEKLMIALGARVVEENKTSKTATQAAGDIATGTSVLGLCCANVSEAYVRALQFCGFFQDSKPFSAAKFALTQDFTITRADAQTIQAVVEAWQAGAIGTTDKNVFFRKAGFIETERSDAQIQEDVNATQEWLQPIVNPAPPVDPNQIAAADKLALEKKKAAKPPPAPPPAPPTATPPKKPGAK